MILEDATFEAYGYYPSDLKPQSNKHILAACELCGVFRTLRKTDYHTFCRSCSQRLGETKKGKKFTEEHKKRLSEAHKGTKHTEETKKRMSEAHKSIKRIPYTEETRRRMSASAIKAMHNSPPSMTKPEKAFKAMCLKYDLPFICNVNAKQHIGNAIPDFIHKTKKIIVEVFGDYYHGQWKGFKNLKYKHTVEGRRKQLKAEGYKLIVFWASDIMREDAEKFVLRELRKNRILK